MSSFNNNDQTDLKPLYEQKRSNINDLRYVRVSKIQYFQISHSCRNLGGSINSLNLILFIGAFTFITHKVALATTLLNEVHSFFYRISFLAKYDLSFLFLPV